MLHPGPFLSTLAPAELDANRLLLAAITAAEAGGDMAEYVGGTWPILARRDN